MDDMVRASPFLGSRGSPFHSKRDIESPFVNSVNPYYMGRQGGGAFSDTRFSPYMDPLRSPHIPQGSPQFIHQRFQQNHHKKKNQSQYKKHIKRIDPRLMPSRNHDLAHLKKNFHHKKKKKAPSHHSNEDQSGTSKTYSSASKSNRKTEDTDNKIIHNDIDEITEEKDESLNQ